MQRFPLLLIILGCSCVTLSHEGAGVSVYQAPLDAPPAKRAMPEGCVRLTTRPPLAMTELEMQGQKDPYRAERNQAGAAGANVLLVLLKQTVARHDFECPGSSPITDCPPSSGAWFRVVFESYACTPDALRVLATNLSTVDRGVVGATLLLTP
jgi:hypothetical protein